MKTQQLGPAALLLAAVSTFVNAQLPQFVYRSSFDNAEIPQADVEQLPMLSDERVMAFGGQVFPISNGFDPNFPRFNMDGDRSRVISLKRGAQNSYVMQTKIGGQFDNYVTGGNLLVFQSNGALSRQISNMSEAPVAVSASGIAQLTSVNRCNVVQFDYELTINYRTTVDNRACEIQSNVDTNTLFFVLASAPALPLSIVQWDGALANEQRRITLPMMTDERYCGGLHTGGQFLVASCAPTATRVRSLDLNGNVSWTIALTRDQLENRVQFAAANTAVLIYGDTGFVSKLTATSGSVLWDRNFGFPIRLARRFDRDYVVTAHCANATPPNSCDISRLFWLTSDGSTDRSEDIVNARDAQLSRCSTTELCLLYPKSDGSRLHLQQRMIQGTTLGEERGFTVSTTAEAQTFSPTVTYQGIHTYIAALDPTSNNMRIKKIVSSTGELVWVQNFYQNSKLGTIESARLVGLQASEQLVNFTLQAQVRQGSSVRTFAMFQRMFASTGERLATIEERTETYVSDPLAVLQGSNLWFSVAQGAISNCTRKTQRVALDSSRIDAAKGSCFVRSLAVIGDDLVLSTSSDLQRISNSGQQVFIHAGDFEHPSIVSADQTRLLSFASENRFTLKVELRNSATGDVLWTRLVPNVLFLRDAKFLPSNNVLIANTVRGSNILGGSMQVLALDADYGDLMWEQNEPEEPNLRTSPISIVPDVSTNTLYVLKRIFRFERLASLDWHVTLERRALDTGARLSEQSLMYARFAGSSLYPGNLYGLNGKLADSRFLLFGSGDQRSQLGLFSGVLDAPQLSQGDISVSARVLSSQGSTYDIEIQINSNSSSQINADLSIWPTGQALWRYVDCSPNCTLMSADTNIGKRITLPANSTTRLRYHAELRDPLGTEQFSAQINGPVTHAETSLRDNLVQLKFSDVLLRDGFE
jgi:outer membrane protein assembly factor BamB